MLSFLKKLGQIIVQGSEIIGGFAPILSAAAPKEAGVITTVSTDLSAMANIVVQVEATSTAIAAATAGGTPLTSAQKLAMAIALIGPIVNQSSVVAGRQVANATLLQQAISEYAQATVDLLNSIDQSAAGGMVVASVKK